MHVEWFSRWSCRAQRAPRFKAYLICSLAADDDGNSGGGGVDDDDGAEEEEEEEEEEASEKAEAGRLRRAICVRRTLFAGKVDPLRRPPLRLLLLPRDGVSLPGARSFSFSRRAACLKPVEPAA